ncbi:MAG: hypothetical protein IJ814_05495 [Paludibacteraceae bacterium]|nr:hypothetical protein [Paludibacteraceae bacterium]
MRKITSLFLAALVAMSSFAAVPAQKRLSLKNAGNAPLVQAAGKIDSPRSIDASKVRKAPKAAEDFVVITEQPAGELKTYTRGGGRYVVSNKSLSYEAQSGTIDIVFGAENKVYFQNIVSGLAYGSWVEGTLSEDGKTITVALGQNLRYVANYDACVAIRLLNYVAGSGFSIDSVSTEVTFSVADDVISLQGTGLASTSLAGVWTDDGSIQNYGDYESVYTPYVQNKELVTLPAGLETKDMPMAGKYYASISDYSSDNATDVAATVKVAQDQDTFYIQGLVQVLPEAWVKGVLSENTIEIPVTYLGTDATENDLYAMGYSRSGVVGVSLIYDAESGAMEVDGYVMLSTSELSNTLSGIYEGLFIGERPELVEVPEDATIVAKPFTATYYDGQSSTEIADTVQVALAGEGEIYIQGLSQEAPEGWIKGQFNATGDTAVFAYGQYVGVSTYGSSVYLLGDDEEMETVADIVFVYDADKDLYTALNVIYDNAKKDDFYYYALLANVKIGEDCDAIWVAGKQGYENTADVTNITIGEDVSGLFAAGENTSNSPKYYDNGEAVRLYAGNTLTISSEKVIGKIVFTLTGNDNQKKLEANVGTYALEGDKGQWTGEAKEIVFSVPNVSGNQARIQKIQLFYLDYSTTQVEAPEDLETAVYKFAGTDTYSEKEVTFEVKVGFDGDDVYFQGLSQYLPEAWVRGTLKDSVVTVPGWYLGVYESFFGDMEIVFSGATFVYDAEKDQFTCAEYTTISGEDAMDEFADITLTRLVEVAATPADPAITAFNGTSSYPSVRFSIPTVGTNGEDLLGDKLSYVFFVQTGNEVTELVLTTDLYEKLEEDLTEIPYNFSDDWDIYNGALYLNQGEEVLRSWSKLGLQSIYRGAGEEHKSNIVWFDVEAYWYAIDNPEAIDNTDAAVKAVKRLENGTIVIEKNGVKYNVLGTQIR